LRTPDSVAPYLTYEQKRLYELIWKRAVASQMESALFDQVAINISNASAQTILRANGSIMTFDGFLHLYREGQDDTEEIGQYESRLLPPMQEQESLTHDDIKTEQHFTQPPPRFSEASLVKKLEELGIGRPSTYASILEVLQERHYVKLENRRFIPETRGRIVTTFLVHFFERYVNTGFTAHLETSLDDISGGRAQWKQVLESFWQDFSKAIANTKELTITNVLNALDEDLAPFFFPPRPDGADPRKCTSCQSGRLSLKLGRHGAFIGCSNYPECHYICDASSFITTSLSQENTPEHTLKDGTRLLGKHPETGEDITLRQGRWGFYIQQGEASTTDKKVKPKRASLPKNIDEKDITLEQAIGLLSLPRVIGLHPETGEPIEAGLGRFGPYVKMGSFYGSLDKDDDILTIGINRAVDALAKKMASVRILGQHPTDSEPVTLRKGRFAPYIQHGSIIADLPRDTNLDTITLDNAITLLEQKGKPLKTLKTKAETKKKSATKSKTSAKETKKTDSAKAPRKTSVKSSIKASTKSSTKPRKTSSSIKKDNDN
ncbi:MAG: topoisomerase DNA-binding C4 zinc finger domain-containing protein, partial [Acetobacter sp.]|nr:topoisomerase DNA-binding C4 zinc finger domain-containing protein [Acetobacter sp.]